MTTVPRPAGHRVGAEAEVEARRIEHMRERLFIEIPSPDTELLASGIIDSPAFVELLLDVRQGGRRVAEFILERRTVAGVRPA
jgi:hypothetical protein